MPAPPAPALPISPQHLNIYKRSAIEDRFFSTWTNISNNEEELQTLILRTCLRNPRVICFSSVPPILQKGPQCGLVALAMVSQECRTPLLVNEIFLHAKNHGFTNYGEIFSVDFLHALATEYLPDFKSYIVQNLQCSADTLLDALQQGSFILIPYDSDFNHAPCLKKGHKAHWALLVGIIESRQGFHILARHGKSRYLACWSLGDLIESNGNLEEEGTIRKYGGYIIPKDGVGGKAGLKGRAIVLQSSS